MLCFLVDNSLLVTEVVTVSPSSQNADFNVLLYVPPHEYTITIEAVNQYGTGDLSAPINISLIISTSTSKDHVLNQYIIIIFFLSLLQVCQVHQLQLQLHLPLSPVLLALQAHL